MEGGRDADGLPSGLLKQAMILRGGLFLLPVWQPTLFRQAGFGTAVLFLLPLVEVAAAIRLLLPVATASQLELAGIACLFTAICCGGLAIVQKRGWGFCVVPELAALLNGVASCGPVSRCLQAFAGRLPFPCAQPWLGG